MYGWFGQVVGESLRGYYNKQVDATFRWSMSWFIFSEVMFFAAFFGALFYARQFAIVITSYSIHYTKLYDPSGRAEDVRREGPALH